jgi:hypothetical protein
MPRSGIISKHKIVENAIDRQKTAENDLLTSAVTSRVPEVHRALLLVPWGPSGYPV